MVPLPIIACDDCGACCLHVIRPPFWYLDDPSWDALVRNRPDLVADLNADLERRMATGGPWEEAPCLWYDPATRRCRHYEHRPEICRDFEVGGGSCLEMRRRHDVSTPFAGSGD